MAEAVAETSRCREHGHPEFIIKYDDTLVERDDLRYLLDALEGAVARGDRFEDGTGFRIGWVLARMRATGDGALTVQEPDMVHTPVWWIDSVNHSLIHRRLQRGTCASVLTLGDVEFPMSRDLARVCDRFEEADTFIMRRGEAAEGDSGWLFTCREPDHGHDDPATCAPLPLYEVAIGYQPRVIPYLALPAGCRIEIGAAGPVISRHEQALSFRPGSLLARNFPGGDA